MHLDSIRSTFYRQTFFADFERQIHQKAEEEIPLTPEIFVIPTANYMPTITDPNLLLMKN